jgi:hypothetical protein
MAFVVGLWPHIFYLTGLWLTSLKPWIEVNGKCLAPVALWGGKYPVQEAEWSHSQCQSCGENKNHLPLPGIEPQFVGRAARTIVTAAIVLPWLVYGHFKFIITQLQPSTQQSLLI